MKKYFALIVVMASISLTACGGADVRVQAVDDYVPDLYRFDVVDSYGVDTAKSNTPLALNPYIDNGLFDIFWEVNSLEDYQVNIRINDRPSVNNSYLVYSAICGAGLACDQSGGAICEYSLDDTLSCNNGRAKYIGDLLQQSSSYLILEICDYNSSYCVYDYRRVLME